MSNCVFGWPIWSDESELYTPTFSGGSWSSSLPLTNLQNRGLSNLARSSDAATASTQFQVDLKTARAVRVLAVILPNISSVGTVRIRGSNSAGDFTTPVYDTGTITPYPAGATAETLGSIKPTLVDVPDAAQTARYWLVEIDDTANVDGYLDVSRLVIAAGWQPSLNMSYGARLGLETETERAVTDGGAAVYNDRPRRRTFDFSIEMLDDDESMGNAFEMQRRAGTAGQMFFVFDPADTDHMHRRSFLSVLRALSPLEFVHFDLNSTAFQLVEEL